MTAQNLSPRIGEKMLPDDAKGNQVRIIPFSFDGTEVRVVSIDDEPWFVGKDVAERLGYANATDAMNKHCKGVAKRYPLQTAGGMQEARILSEPDVLRLIVSSKLPAAERFERWVFEDVLPTIRRTGGYLAGAPDAKTIGGIVKAVVTKQIESLVVTHIESAFAQLAEIGRMVREDLDPQLLSARLAADPRVRLGAFIGVRELLDEMGAVQKGRDGLNRHIGHLIRDAAEAERVEVQREDRNGRWLFPSAWARRWAEDRIKGLIANHNATATGQGLIPFGPPARKRRGALAPVEQMAAQLLSMPEGCAVVRLGDAYRLVDMNEGNFPNGQTAMVFDGDGKLRVGELSQDLQHPIPTEAGRIRSRRMKVGSVSRGVTVIGKVLASVPVKAA
jgi:prophage antirepressor-like protein